MFEQSDIKRIREEIGMTQAELAQKVGIAQQTIEKIENGKVERTGYMREIGEALGVVKPSITPEIVLTIAASQWNAVPTASQVIKALEAGGFRIVKNTDEAAEPPIDALAIVREIMDRRDLAPSALAKKVGLAASTLCRPFNSAHTGELNTRTLNKIIAWDKAQG
jgi:transcriptional regulator with XRE-family HTH domain